MKKLIITLILVTALISSLSSRPLMEADNITGSMHPSFLNSSTGTNTDFGTKYYRSNSIHRFKVKPGANLSLKNLDANVKIVPWDKDFGELEIMKISSESELELEKVMVWVDNDKDITVGTCCSEPAPNAMVSVILKVPQIVYTKIHGEDENEIVNIDPKRYYAR